VIVAGTCYFNPGFGRAENRFRPALRDGGGKSEHQRARCRVTPKAFGDICGRIPALVGVRRTVPQKTDSLNCSDGHRPPLQSVMVKRCGKSAPREAQATRHGKPHRVQGQIGNPGAARSRFRESETDSGYRLLRQMILSIRKGADRIRLTALPKPIQFQSGGTSYASPISEKLGTRITRPSAKSAAQRFKLLRQFKPTPLPLWRTGGDVIRLSAAGSLSFPTRSTTLTAITSGWELKNVRVV